jgi:hypothetical protein
MVELLPIRRIDTQGPVYDIVKRGGRTFQRIREPRSGESVVVEREVQHTPAGWVAGPWRDIRPAVDAVNEVGGADHVTARGKK